MVIIKDTTIVCIDCISYELALFALRASIKDCKFDKVLFLSDIESIPDKDIQLISIPKIKSKEEYSEFVIKELYKYLDTKYVLIIQFDGYIINPDAWTDDFFKYDYVGARWVQSYFMVGNGGFSLRSKKLLKFCADNFIAFHPEDCVICCENKELLEKNGFKFATMEDAYKFSIEDEPYTGQFGWHSNTNPCPKII